jgi:hypothetical protein
MRAEMISDIIERQRQRVEEKKKIDAKNELWVIEFESRVAGNATLFMNGDYEFQTEPYVFSSKGRAENMVDEFKLEYPGESFLARRFLLEIPS